MAPTKNHTRVIGRLFWDPTHPSPWMTFDHKTAFQQWATALRKARPGTKTEWHYIDMVWTADAMLRFIQRDAVEDARTAPEPEPATYEDNGYMSEGDYQSWGRL